MKPIRVVVADDHDLVRAGLRALLQSIAVVEVVAGDGVDRRALWGVADVVIKNILMPELNGLEATARIAKEFPGVRVLILSMNSAEEFVLHAVRGGASGYLLKNARIAELEQALRAVAAGQTYLTPAVC